MTVMNNYNYSSGSHINYFLIATYNYLVKNVKNIRFQANVPR